MPITVKKVEQALQTYTDILRAYGDFQKDDFSKDITPKSHCIIGDYADAERGDSVTRTITICQQKDNVFSVETYDAAIVGAGLNDPLVIPKEITDFLRKHSSCNLWIDKTSYVLECEKKTTMTLPIEQLSDHLIKRHPFYLSENMKI